MKWYLHKHHNQHLKELKVKRGDSMEVYYPWVIQIANTFARDSVAIGTLNLQDLVQAGYVGLIDAHNTVDHERGQAEKWSYIKKRIKWAIRREIDKYSSFISMPINKAEQRRINLTKADKILVNLFPKFFDEELSVEDTYSWEHHQLAELIDDYLYAKFKNIDHVNILKYSYGMDIDKPMSMKKLGSKYRTTPNYINQIKQRMLKSLKQDEDFKIIIKNFYDN